MSYVESVIKKFKKEYGKDWKKRFFAWKNANPGAYTKGVQTARRRGDKIVNSLAKTAKGKARARRLG